MHVSSRTYLTSGIAALGAGVIALSPVQPVPHQLPTAQQPAIQNLAVNLAAAIDPITPIVDTFTTTFANIGALATLAGQAPFPFLSTIFANVQTYFGELTSGNAGLIPEQIINNIKTFFQAGFDPGTTLPVPVGPTPPGSIAPIALGDYPSKTLPPIGNSPEAVNAIFVNVFVGQAVFEEECSVDGDCYATSVGPITNFMNTHASGLLLGLLGPILSPVVQLSNSVNAIVGSLQTGDVIGAINELINIPVNVVNAFLNGAGYLDLTNVLSNFVTLPDDITKIGVNLGGLLNAVPQDGSLRDADNPPTTYAGGVAMDALGFTQGAGPDPFAIGLPVGLLGSIIGSGQFLAQQMVVTPPDTAESKSVRSAATAAPADETPETLSVSDAADAPSAGGSQAPADSPARTRGSSRAKAAASNADDGSPSSARGRRGAA
jgi:hypothetical protein